MEHSTGKVFALQKRAFKRWLATITRNYKYVVCHINILYAHKHIKLRMAYTVVALKCVRNEIEWTLRGLITTNVSAGINIKINPSI